MGLWSVLLPFLPQFCLLLPPLWVLFLFSFLLCCVTMFQHLQAISASGSLSPALVLAITFAAMSEVPNPYRMPSLWRAFHSACLFSSHFFMPSHFVPSQVTYTSSVVVIFVSISFNCAIWHACCLIFHFFQLLHSPSVLDYSEISLLSLFPFLFCSHYSLTAVKAMHFFSPGMSPSMLLVSSPSTIFKSLSISYARIILPGGFPPTLMAIAIVFVGRHLAECRLAAHSAVSLPSILQSSRCARSTVPRSILC